MAWLKKHGGLLIVLLSVGAVVTIAFSNQEMENAWDTIIRLHPGWMAGAFLCWVAYAGFEGAGTWIYLRRQGFRISLLRTLYSTMIGFFYSNITPSAAGGQPMQVNSLRKAGVPVGYGTLAVTVRFIANQFAVSFLSLALFLLHTRRVMDLLGQKIWLFRVGWVISFLSVPVVLLAAFHPGWIRVVSEWIIRLLVKLRILQHPEETRARVWETLEKYHEALLLLVRCPGQILVQLLCSLISMLGLTATIIFVYHAFGLSGTPWPFLLTLSAMLFVSASYTPLPGASGAQEGGFLLFYQGVFTDGTIGLALLVWRFFTYYLFLIAGVFFVVAEHAVTSKNQKAAP